MSSGGEENRRLFFHVDLDFEKIYRYQRRYKGSIKPDKNYIIHCIIIYILNHTYYLRNVNPAVLSIICITKNGHTVTQCMGFLKCNNQCKLSHYMGNHATCLVFIKKIFSAKHGLRTTHLDK